MVETRGGRRFAVLFFVAAFVVLVFGRWVQPVDHVALSAAAPFNAAISGMAAAIGDGISGLVEGPKLRSQNAALQRDVARLIRENVLLQEQAYENKQFRKMLHYSDGNIHLNLLRARVIGHEPNN